MTSSLPFSKNPPRSVTAKIPVIAVAALFITSSDSLIGQPANTNSGTASTDLGSELHGYLQRQAAAMATVYLEFTETQTGGEVPAYYGGPSVYAACFQGKRFYLRTTVHERKPDGSGTPTERVHEDAFDGLMFYSGDPDRPRLRAPAVLQKFQPDDTSDPDRFDKAIYCGYFADAGFYVPRNVAELATFESIPSLILHYVNTSPFTKTETVGDEVHLTMQIDDPILVRAQQVDLESKRKELSLFRNGPAWIAQETEALKRMQNMQPKRTVSFVLDPKRGYAITERRDFTAAGEPIVRVVCDKWHYYEPADIWLPSRVIENYFTDRYKLTTFSQQPRLTVQFELNRVEFKAPADIRFTIDYKKAGSIIIDRTTAKARANQDHQVTYIVAAGGKELRAKSGAALREMQGRRSNRWWFIILNLVVVISVLIIFKARYRADSTKGR